MKTCAILTSGIMSIALVALAGGVQAATFVYVSNAEDGDIGTYTLLPDGNLLPAARVAAGKPVMPMSVSPDRRFLYAAVRSKPFAVMTYAIDPKTGALVYAIDPASGTLSLRQKYPTGKGSNWVEIVSFD